MTKIHSTGQKQSPIFKKLLVWARENQKNYSGDYFEKGKGSCYKNYRWKPKLIFPRVARIIKCLDLQPGQKVLDFGCAKGFYVKCFLKLNYDAFGVDISQYALSKSPPEAKNKLFLLEDFPLEAIDSQYFDLTLAKDVLEHVPPFALKFLIKQLKRVSRKLLVVVPCCRKNGAFINPEDEKDINHLIRLCPKDWKNLIGGIENRSLCRALKDGKSRGSVCLVCYSKV